MLSPGMVTMASAKLSPATATTMGSVLLMLSPGMATMASALLMLSPTDTTMASVLLMLNPDMATMASVLLSPTMAMATMVRALPEEKKPPRGRGMTERRGLLCIAIDHGDNKNVTKY